MNVLHVIQKIHQLQLHFYVLKILSKFEMIDIPKAQLERMVRNTKYNLELMIL